MSNIVPREVFLLLQSVRVTEHAVAELTATVASLRKATVGLALSADALVDQIAKSEADARFSKARFDVLNRQYQAAVNAATLEELTQARDAYASSVLHNQLINQSLKQVR